MASKALHHYDLIEKLGEGGMGIVYKARDTRLDRFAALKVLPSEKFANVENRRRFVQEAKSASALNHPNIVTMYEINESDGVQYIAMEYVPGKDLQHLLRERSLTLPEALEYAVQIAAALSAAHEAGIVHRDLKPANIMVTDRGIVKILDFGLAKLGWGAGSEEAFQTLSLRLDAGQTQQGTILGTVAYMSPEQALGKPIDTRSDIFSFGSVLYEMITGRPAFQGENSIATLSAILHVEPVPASSLAKDLSPELESIISGCLKKDRDQRIQRISEVMLALGDLAQEPNTGRFGMRAGDVSSILNRSVGQGGVNRTAAVPAPRASSFRSLAARALVGILLVAAAGATAWRFGFGVDETSEEPQPAARLTSDPGLSTDPTISSDGKLLVYASDRDGTGNLALWTRQINGGEPVRLTSDSSDSYQPCFSPDGTMIAFRSNRDGGGIYVIPTLGGESRLIARDGKNPRFSPDGKKLVYWVGEQQAAGDIYISSATGGEAKQLTLTPKLQARFPIWSPDGNYLLFVAQEAKLGAPYDWWVVPATGGAAVATGAFKLLSEQGLRTSYSVAPREWIHDRVYFSAGASKGSQSILGQNIVNPNDAAHVWSVGLSRSHQAEGRARRLTFGTGLDVAFSVAPAGGLVFASLTETVNIWSLPAKTSEGKVTGDLERLTAEAGVSAYPSISADSKAMAFWSDRSGNADIWLKELATGKDIRLTVDPVFETYPVLAPDGGKVAYAMIDGTRFPSIGLMKLGPDWSPGPVRTLCSKCGTLSDLSATGVVAYYNTPDLKTVLLDAESGAAQSLFRYQDLNQADPRLSQDGRWVALHTLRTPLSRQILIAPASAGTVEADWIPVTDGMTMDRFAAWSPDGKVLYFISEADGFRCIAARRLNPSTKQPVGPVFYVSHFHGYRTSMMNFANANMSRFSVARDRIVLSLGERRGNLWLTRLQKSPI